MFGDLLNLLSKLTLRRLFNWVLNKASYMISLILRRSLMFSYPLSLSIEPTNFCNLRCPQCPSGLKTLSRSRGYMDSELYKKLIDEVSEETIYLMLYFQGEPFMHSELVRFIIYAHEKGMYVMTSTNAHFINADNAEAIVKSGLDKLIISMDGVTDDVYRIYRQGGDIEKVKNAVKSIAFEKERQRKKTPIVELQYLVLSHNEHQMAEAKYLKKALGADKLTFKTAQIYDVNANSTLLPKQKAYSRYKLNKAGQYELKNRKQFGCYKMWQSAVITWKGDVVPCCYDKDALHDMGNIRERSLKDIWKSEKYKTFRNTVLSKRTDIEMCNMCDEK